MGPYDNETGLYVYDRDYDAGEWYEDAGGNLYIIPDGISEIEGPDNTMLAVLNTLWREGLRMTDERLQRYHLTYISSVLHRWNEEDGFYHA